MYGSSRSRSLKRPCTCGPQGFGAQVGSQLGQYAETGLRGLAKSWFGIGDYTLKSNSLVKTGSSDTSKVEIIPSGPRETRIIYREYIGDVYTHPSVAGQFYAKTYALNPGLMEAFPWLCSIAQNYEQWTPNGIIFEFRSTSSEYVATQALGSVIMATEYDALDSNFANKQEMLNAAYSNESKPSERIVHGVECDPRDNPNRIFYVRSAHIPSGGSVRDYDLGNFTIATQGGSTANLNLGSLYIHYDITFRKEQIYNGPFLKGALWYRGNLVSPTGPNPLGTSSPTGVLGNTGSDISVALSTIQFPVFTTGAHWIVSYQIIGTSANFTNPPVSLSGMTRVWDYSAPSVGTSNSQILVVSIYRQDASKASLSYGITGSIPTSPTTAVLDIRQVNGY